MIKPETMYVSIGSDVNIKCPINEVFSWHYSDSKIVLALCERGHNSINPVVSSIINVTSDCQLRILNVTTNDLRIYLCTANNTKQGDGKILVKLRSKYVT